MKSTIKVGIVEDHNLVMKAISSLISYQEEFEMILEASGFEEMAVKLKSKLIPDVILMDYNLPDFDGPTCVKHIRDHYSPHIKILGLSTYKEEKIIQDMIEAGANGFLVKDADFEELKKGILEAHEKGFYFNDFVGPMILKRMHGEQAKDPNSVQLNDREVDILRLICRQKTNTEIADELCMSKNTINSYRNKLLEKTNSMNTAGLVVFAIKNGFFTI